MRFRSALLIGLGSRGSEIARRIGGRIRSADPATATLIGLIELHDDGTLADGFDGTKYAEIALGSEPAYSECFSAVASAEDSIEKAIADSLSRLRRRDVLVQLREARYVIDDKIAIYFISPLGDRVGSPALIGFLSITRRLTRSRLAGQQLHRTVLGFFPDLFKEQRDVDECYARTYVTLQELEIVAVPQSYQEPLAFEFISLFTSRNEANEELGSYGDVADILGETFALALRQRIAVDESFAVAFASKTPEGAVTRYSSLGMAKLVFPRDEVCRILHARFAVDVLSDYSIAGQGLFDRHVVSADVRKFIFDDGLDRIEPQLERGPSGAAIWTEFRTNASFSEDANVELTLAALSEDADTYERTELTVMTARTRETRARLVSNHVDNLRKVVHERLDSHSPRYVHGFLDVFLNESSDHTSGDIIDDAVSADNIDRGARKFFDQLFDIHRGDLSKLQQEINSKEAVLAQHEAARALPGNDRDPELEAIIELTTEEMKTLRRKHGELAHKIRMHDLRLQDGAQRRLLLLQQRAEKEAKVREHAAELKPLDNEYRAKRRALVHEREAFAAIKRGLALYGAGVLVLSIVVALLLFRVGPPIANYATRATQVVCLVMLVYAVWAGTQWYRMRERIIAAHLAMTRAAARKREALGILRQLYEDTFRIIYDFARHGAAVDWATEFKDAVKDLRGSISTFESALQAYYDEEVAAASLSPAPSATLFVRHVTAAADVTRLQGLADHSEHERSVVRGANPLSKIFAGMIATGGLQKFRTQVDTAAIEVLTPIRTMTIEQFLQLDDPKNSKSTERVAQLFDFGSPLVQLRIEGTDDEFRNVSYFGTPDGEESTLVELARRLGRQPQIFRADRDTEVVLVTTKVGFPAFHIALIAHCDHARQSHADVGSLQAIPEWELRPLIPSEIELGNEDDPARQLACQSLALGLIEERPEGMVFENRVVGKDYRHLIESLRSTRGTGLTARLKVRAAAAMAQSGAADLLSSFLHHPQFDAIDQRIIQKMLDRLEDGV